MKQLIFLGLLWPALLAAQLNGYTPPSKTGNAAIDDANHTKAKTEWIKNNPEAYRAQGGRPEEVLNANQPEPQKEKPKLAPFVAQKSYILVDVRAVAAPDWQVSEAELSKEIELVREKIQAGVCRLEFGNDSALRWFVSKDVDFRGLQVLKSNTDIEWFFKNETCPTCSKTFYLKTETAPIGVLVYTMKDQDQDSKFAFQFTFQLIP